MHSKTKHKLDVAGTAAIILAVLCWASGPIFIRYLTGYLDAWTQNSCRYSIAAIFWLPFLCFSIRKGTADARAFKLALLAAVPNIIMQSLWAWTFYFLKPGFATLIARSSVVWTMLFSLILFVDERTLVKSKRFWIGILLSVAGLVTVVVSKYDFYFSNSLTGILITLAAAITWSVYSVCAKIAFRKIDVRIGFSIVSIYTAAGLAPLAFIFGEPSQALHIGLYPWAAVIISAILSIALAHTLFYASIKRIGATIPAVVQQLSPYATLLISMVVFAERLNLVQWLGGIVLVAGAALAIWAQQHLRKFDLDKPLSSA